MTTTTPISRHRRRRRNENQGIREHGERGVVAMPTVPGLHGGGDRSPTARRHLQHHRKPRHLQIRRRGRLASDARRHDDRHRMQVNARIHANPIGE